MNSLILLTLLKFSGFFGGNPQLQVLIDQAPDNSTLRIPPGTYYSDKAITIEDRTNLKLEGGGLVKVICRDPYEWVMLIVDSKNVTVSGLYFTHEMAKDDSGCEGGVIDVKSSQVTKIEDCELEGSGVIGVHAKDCIDLSIEHCNIHHNSLNAIDLANCQQVEIKSNIIRYNAGFMYTESVARMHIRDNLISNNGGYWRDDIPKPGPRIGKRDNKKPHQ